MRVLVINHEYPPIGGGAGKACRNLCHELVHRGHAVLVLTSQFRDLPRHEFPAAGDGPEIVRVPCRRLHEHTSNLREFLSFLGAAAWRITALHDRWWPEVALAYFTLPGGLIARYLYRRRGLPYVLSVRGGDVPGFQKELARLHWCLRPAIRHVCRGAAQLVANSPGFLELMSQTYVHPHPHAIPNGINTTIYCPADEAYFVPPEKDISLPAILPLQAAERASDHKPIAEAVRLLTVGRLVRQKGLDLLINAVAGLPSHLRSRVRLRIVGDGPLRASLTAQLRQANLLEQTSLAGWVHGDHVLLHEYRQAEAFVLPSRDEGLPNALLEARACGLPTVSTRTHGGEFVIHHERDGLLVNLEDVADLRWQLARLLEDASLRQRLGQAGRQDCLERFSWGEVARQYEEVLEAALKPRESVPLV